MNRIHSEGHQRKEVSSWHKHRLWIAACYYDIMPNCQWLEENEKTLDSGEGKVFFYLNFGCDIKKEGLYNYISKCIMLAVSLF